MKTLIWIVVAIIIVGGGAYYFIQHNAANVPVAQSTDTNSLPNTVSADNPNTESNAPSQASIPTNTSLSGKLCDYFPQNMVSSVLGVNVISYHAVNPATTCNYVTTTQGPGAVLILLSSNMTPDIAYQAAKYSGKVTDVSGIGDKAWWYPLPAGPRPSDATVYFVKNGKVFTVYVGVAQNLATNVASAENLAKQVVKLLP